MPQILLIIPVRSVDTLHRTLSMLSFQKDRSFSACVVDISGAGLARPVAAEFEDRLSLTVVETAVTGTPVWKMCLEAAPAAEWVCFLRPDVDFSAQSMRRMRRCIKDHPAYDVFHWNLVEPFRKYRLKTRPDQLFLKVFTEGVEAPLSSFVFRAHTLRVAFTADPEAAGMDLAVILSAAAKTGIRTVRRERIGYRAPVKPEDPALVEKEVRARLAFLRWSERFFGKEYPLDTGERLDLFAREVARLYPAYPPDRLKEDMNAFAVVNGPIRRMRAASALKAAIKAREAAPAAEDASSS